MRIPRWIHVPWFAVALVAVMACQVAYGWEPAYRHPITVVALSVFMAWCYCSRWMR